MIGQIRRFKLWWMKVGSRWRVWRLRRLHGAVVGENTTIGPNSVIGSSGYRLVIGSNVTIVSDAYLDGHITIGNNVILAPRVTILSRNHAFDEADALPYGTRYDTREVVIEDFVWIGFGVCITPGTHVAEGAVVAMGSVVTKDVPPCAVVGGNPARVLRYRNEAHYERLKKERKYLNDIRGAVPHIGRKLRRNEPVFSNSLSTHGVVFAEEMIHAPVQWQSAVLYALWVRNATGAFGNMGDTHAVVSHPEVSNTTIALRYEAATRRTIDPGAVESDARELFAC